MTVRDGTVSDEACEQAASDALEFVMIKLPAIKKEKGLVGVWMNAWRTAWATSRRSVPSEPVAWLVESMHGGNVMSAEFTVIPRYAEECATAGWRVTPLYPSPPTKPEVTPAMVEAACKSTDPLLFSGDAQTEHMAASPYKVEHVKNLVRTKIRAALSAALEVAP